MADEMNVVIGGGPGCLSGCLAVSAGLTVSMACRAPSGGVRDPTASVERARLEYLDEKKRHAGNRDYGVTAEGLCMGCGDASGRPIVLPRVDA